MLFFLEYGSLNRPGRFIAWLALSTLVLIPLLAVLLAQFYSPPFLIGSARYLLSALAQTIAALLAVSFTVAFVIFQVVSNRLTPGAASVIPRNPALHALLAIGAATILSSLVLLAFVADATKSPTSVLLAKYAPAATIASLLSGSVVLSLVVFSFWRILEYLRPETILRIHSEAIMKSQRRMAKGRELKISLSDILDELHILTELGERLCTIEDARSLGFLYENLNACLAHSLRIYDDAIQGGTDSIADMNPMRYGGYSRGLELILGQAARTCDRLCTPRANEEDAQRCWMDMYKRWVEPGLAVYDSQLSICAGYDKKVFGHVVGMISYLRSRAKRPVYFWRTLISWCDHITSAIQDLDQRAHRDEAMDLSILGRGTQPYPIEHLIMLFRSLTRYYSTALREKSMNVWARLDLIRPKLPLPRNVQSEPTEMLKHWRHPTQQDDAREQIEGIVPTDYVQWIRAKAWSVLIDAGSVLYREGQKAPVGPDLVEGYFSLLGDVFEQELRSEGRYGRLCPSLLEDALEIALKENLANWRKGDTPDQIYGHFHFVKFWLRLRIYISENRGIWPISKCARAAEMHLNLPDAIDMAIEQGIKEGGSRAYRFFSGIEESPMVKIQAALARLSETLHSKKP